MFVPYDDLLAQLGAIEPEFVEEIVGWANEEILITAGMVPVATWASEVPVRYIPGAFTRRPTPEPIPITRTVLKWRAAAWW